MFSNVLPLIFKRILMEVLSFSLSLSLSLSFSLFLSLCLSLSLSLSIYISIYISVRGPGALVRICEQCGPSSKPLFTTLWRLRRVGHHHWGGRGAGVGSQSSQRGVLGCQSHPKVVQIWSISYVLVRISRKCGLKFLS